MDIKTNTYIESKPRYEILDGLRGVAALGVVNAVIQVRHNTLFLISV